jgi:predicted transcriptional regulator
MSKQVLSRKHPRGLVETPHTVDAATSATRPATPHVARATPSATPSETPPATPPETPGDDKKREVIRLYNEGKTMPQVAKVLGLNTGTVSRILREAGLIDLDPSEIRSEFKGLKEALTVNISNTMQRVEALERRFDELKALVAAGRGPSTAVPPAVSGGKPSNPPEGKEGCS